MSIPPIQQTSTDTTSSVDPVTVVPSCPLPRVPDSIHTPPKSSRWSWSYMKIAAVSITLIAACAVAAFFMKHIFRNADRAAEYDAQIDYYRDCLAKES